MQYRKAVLKGLATLILIVKQGKRFLKSSKSITYRRLKQQQ